MDATDGFEGFVEIVERGSLTAAADALGLPRATLSRQLARLEERLGVRLLHRTTRRITPTRAGDALYERARRVVDEAHAAVEAVRRVDDVPRGLLRVTTPPTFDGFLATPLLSFAARYPEVELEVDASARTVDLVAEGFDVAIRGRGADMDPSLVTRRLFRSDLVAVASPAYLAAHGTPATPDDLAHHTLIRGFTPQGAPEQTWPLATGGSVRVDGRVASNDVVFRRTAALAGHGLATLPMPVVSDALHDGRLVKVLYGVIGASGAASIVYADRAFLHPKVRAFIDHMVAWAEALPSDACGGAHAAAPPRASARA